MWMRNGSGMRWLAICLAGLFVAGCAAKENTALEQAKATYSQAESNPEVVSNAPLMLRDAGETLRRAEQAENWDEATHLAYLAERKAQTAIAMADKQEAQKEAARLGQEKQLLLLQAREAEAERARREAETKAEELQETRSRAEQAQQEIQQLRSQISELKAKRTQRGIVLTLGNVLFGFNKTTLQPAALRSMDKLADFLKEHSDREIRIEGYTDNIGSEEYNQKLSERRAEAVARALQARGISPERMFTVGYGEEYPVASNDNPGGRQLNRRVEVVILNPGEKAEEGREAPAH
jgi:OOP family OmpA-OmpF porin